MVYKTKVDIIYERLLAGIEAGHYNPGEHLVISQISKENAVSDIPVREAIRRLESEGYVRIYANQGAVVCNFTPELITEIFQIKAVLEGYACRLAAEVLTEEDYKYLRGLNEKIMEESLRKNYAGSAECNMQFHMYMYYKLKQTELCNMIEGLWRKYRITKKVFQLEDHSMNSYKEHKHLLELMESKQFEEIEAFARAHKMNACEELIKQLDNR